MGPLPESSLAGVDDRCLRGGRCGWGKRDKGGAQVESTQPAVGAVGWCTDAIVRVTRDARSPCDHFDFETVG